MGKNFYHQLQSRPASKDKTSPNGAGNKGSFTPVVFSETGCIFQKEFIRQEIFFGNSDGMESIKAGRQATENSSTYRLREYFQYKY